MMYIICKTLNENIESFLSLVIYLYGMVSIMKTSWQYLCDYLKTN